MPSSVSTSHYLQWGQGEACIAQFSLDKIITHAHVSMWEMSSTNKSLLSIFQSESSSHQDSLDKLEAHVNKCHRLLTVDKMWYRGQVLEVRGPEVLVKFVDYGSGRE